MKIEEGKYVQLAYEIFAVDGDEKLSVFKFTADMPDAFVFGNDPGMIENFKKNIAGLEQGEKFSFTLSPDDAFGPKDPNMVMDLPAATFNVDGKFDSEYVREGATIPMQTQDGFRLNGVVLAVTKDTVTLDFNHPLAGETILYEGEVLLVRDATPEDLAPKHHCGSCGGCKGGSCGSDCDCQGDCGNGCN